MWAADGRTLFFLSNRGGSVDLWQQRLRGSNDLWELTVANGRERQLTRFPRDGELGGGLAASKTHLYFTMTKNVGDIWVVDVANDQP